MFCVPKGIVKKIRKQTIEQEKIFAYLTSEKGLYPEYLFRTVELL